MPRTPRWNDDELRDAVALSRSLGEVCRRLGLRPGGGTYRSLHRHILRLGIDESHLPRVVDGRIRPTRRRWTDEQLRVAVSESVSIAQVLRQLGYEPNGGTHRFIKGHIRRLGLNTDHFTGQGWSRGLRGVSGFKPRPLDQILVANSQMNSANLRRRLIAEGLKEPKCEICGINTWRGKPLPLALDHINGDPCDNRLENLRIVCPNCHALTETWCARNRQPAYPNWQRDQA
jgi:HNH endonuclease